MADECIACLKTEGFSCDTVPRGDVNTYLFTSDRDPITEQSNHVVTVQPGESEFAKVT